MKPTYTPEEWAALNLPNPWDLETYGDGDLFYCKDLKKVTTRPTNPVTRAESRKDIRKQWIAKGYKPRSRKD